MSNSQGPDSRAIEDLVRRFAASESAYSSSSRGYQEAEVRSEFIDPLLDAFGWDTANRAGVDADYRPVLREETQRREDSHAKKPDYTLRNGRKGLLYVEAKKPSVDILRDMASIRQARAYGYTDGHPIVILTNFRDLSVYDTSTAALEDDLPETCRLFTCHYTDYEVQQESLAALLLYSNVVQPGWANQFVSTRPKQAIPADEAFVAQINVWRKALGADIVTSHPNVSGPMLNDVVQKLINRLIFVRMCEDRGIEGEAILRAASVGPEANIEELFRRLDRRYNTGLFDQSASNAEPAPLIDAEILGQIVDSLYSPRSPFSFAVLDADFLGLVYETSLSEYLEIIDVGEGRGVRLTEKLEYAKRDVVATPQELVTATVEAAWGSVPFRPGEHPKVLDFAVGSGRFLVSAFDQYLKLWTQHLLKTDVSRLVKVGPSEWRLPFEEKRRILRDNFFAIDVDYNAVEVARFSLLVKLLEDETAGTLPGGQKILPDLDENIIHGNTLVRELPGATQEQIALAVPLDLAQSALPTKFDLIIGNPPYMQTKEMKSYNSAEFTYYKEHYSLLHQQFDKYFAFIEFAIEHSTDAGVVSIVVPNKWMTNVAGENLRARLSGQTLVGNLANFRNVQIFPGKSIYVCALTLVKGKKNKFTYSEPVSVDDFAFGQASSCDIFYRQSVRVGRSAWVLPANTFESSILDALNRDFVPLSDVVSIRNGIQTSKNKTYILTQCAIHNGEVSFSKNGRTWTIEAEVTRPYLEDSRTIRTYHSVTPDARVIYPYRQSSAQRNSSGYEIIPLNEMKRLYPKAYDYLAAHEAGMSDRDMGPASVGSPFYAYGRVQAIGYAAAAPKVLYSVNQKGKKYGLDETGVVFSSGGTAGEVALYPTVSGYSLDFVLALLDQAPIEFFLRKRGSPFRGGYFSRGTDVMEVVPVPKLDFMNSSDRKFHDHASNAMAKLRQYAEAESKAAPRDLSQIRGTMSTLKEHMDNLFRERWGLNAEHYEQLKL